MSDYVRFKGKIKKVDIGDLTATEYLLKQMSDRDVDIYNRMSEKFGEVSNYELIYEFSSIEDKYAIVNNSLYEILSKTELDCEEDIYEADVDIDDNINFHLMYYNGGCSFDEALEEAIKKLSE